MRHRASPDFWALFDALPDAVRVHAQRNFTLLKENSSHPSLHYKKIGRFRSVRVGLKYRALGVEAADGVVWFWIGSHADYDKLLAR